MIRRIIPGLFDEGDEVTRYVLSYTDTCKFELIMCLSLAFS